jgi:hypothetical protein
MRRAIRVGVDVLDMGTRDIPGNVESSFGRLYV